MARHSFYRNNENLDGQVLVLFALASAVLVGLLALAVDVGYLMTERRETQNAVDSAAMAGAISLLSGGQYGQINQSVDTYLTSNGMGTNRTVTTNVTGDRKDGSVTVEVRQPVTKLFVGAIYGGDWNVSAKATAQVLDFRNAQYALVALESPGIEVNGTITLNVVNGSMMSNDDVVTSSNGGSGSNIVLANGTIDAHGIIQPTQHWNATAGMWEYRPTYDDPLTGLLAPGSNPADEISEDDLPDCFQNHCTLHPGVYKDLGKIRIKHTATLTAGLYIFNGTSIELNDSGSRIEGHNVMLFFDGPTNSTYFDPKIGAVLLTAPENSPYTDGLDGMVLWINNCTEFDSQGSQEFSLQGVFYAPCSDVTLHGNPYGDTIDGQVIVGSLDLRGSTEMVVRYHGYVDTPRIEVYLTK